MQGRGLIQEDVGNGVGIIQLAVADKLHRAHHPNTLFPDSFAVAGKVNEVNGATFMVVGDAELKQRNLCLVKDIDKDVYLEPGMEIVTSGDGGLFPEGIPIGVIESVDYSNPLQVTATLRPYSQIGKLEDVFIMVPYVEEEPEETAAAVG